MAERLGTPGSHRPFSQDIDVSNPSKAIKYHRATAFKTSDEYVGVDISASDVRVETRVMT